MKGFLLFPTLVTMYPVSFLKVFTEFLKNRFGISEPGGVPFSKQSGHSLSSDSMRDVRIPIKQNKKQCLTLKKKRNYDQTYNHHKKNYHNMVSSQHHCTNLCIYCKLNLQEFQVFQ